MIAVALKGLLGRKLRAFLTGFAVVLGVAMVSGTFVLTDTISKAFDQIFNGTYENTSAVISGKEIVKGSSSGNATISASLLEQIRGIDGVAAATGAIYDLGSSSNYTKLVGPDGVIGGGDAPTLGFGIDTSEPRFNPLNLVEGQWATGQQVVIDKGTASVNDLKVGNSIGVSTRARVEQFRISGIAKFGTVDSLGGASLAVFDIPTAQRLLGKESQFDSISVAAENGVSPAALATNIREILPASAQVRTGAEQAQASAKDTKTFMKFIQLFLLAFGGIALFVGAFVIFNTLSITVAQRTREFATLRALGASRRQVLRSVLLEGVVIGFVASLVGLLLGVGLAKGLTWLLGVLQLDLPQTGTVFQTRTVVVSLLVGVGITVVATVGPALRATRVPPIAAVREGSILPRSRFAPVAPFVALGLIAAGAAAFGTALGVGALETRSVLLLIAVGCISVFLGVGLISSRLVRPLVKVVGQPARHGGGEAGRLASENAVRNPSRTASTAAALMIGLALVTVVATLGTSMRNSDKASIASQLDADFVVTSENGFDVFQAQAGDLIASVPGVGIVTNVRQEKARVAGVTATVHGVDPTIGQTARFQWKEGNDALLADLGADGVILKQRFADKHNLAVGSTVSLLTPAGERHSFTVRGLFQPAAFDRMDPLFGDVVTSRSAFDSAFARPQNILALVDLGPDATPATLAGVRDVLAEYPGTIMRDEAEYVTSRAAGLDKLLNLLYVLLALSVVVSLFGMINTLVLSTFERTRELGMLRAVGMTRRQVRRMVRHESVITALIGAALGLPIGVALAALVTRALADQGLVFSVSIGYLAVFTAVAVVAGVVAAIAPARRAGRLNVLAALHYE